VKAVREAAMGGRRRHPGAPRRAGVILALGVLILAASTLALTVALSGSSTQRPPVVHRHPPPPPPAGRQVRDSAEIRARARAPGAGGKTFYLRAGVYRTLDFSGVWRRARVTFRPYPGERVAVAGAIFSHSAGVRLEGLRITGTLDVQPGPNQRLEFVGNDIGGFAGAGINVRENSSGILIARNHIHDLARHGRAPADDLAGYGIRLSAPYGPLTRVRILRNTIARLANDGIELGTVNGVVVAGNDVSEIRPEPGDDAHADPLMVWADARNVVVRRNRFHDNDQPIYFADGTVNGVLEDNVVTADRSWCMQMGGIGERTDGVSGAVLRRNTFWGCRYGGLIVRGRGRGNVVTGNVLQTLEGTRLRRQFAVEDHNLIRRGYRTGRHDVGGRPRFRDRARGDLRLARGARPARAGTTLGSPRGRRP
jgi:hypothetical protein